MKLSTLTEYEKLSMAKVVNLSDGHARQLQSFTQRKIIERLPEMFLESERKSQIEIEKKFKRDFYHFAGQTINEKNDIARRILICHSASSACEIIGNFLRLKGFNVGLLEPTFDNIPRILLRHGVTLRKIDEQTFSSPNFEDQLDELDIDAIFIVYPNNPTGFTLDKGSFEKLARYCKNKNKILIIDFAFRFYSLDLLNWSQYSFLDELGVSYLLMEDTGKTWPCLDLKVGMLTPSENFYKEIADIHDDYLLNVSPFILELLSAYIEDSNKYGLKETILRTIQRNRDTLNQALKGTFIKNETGLNINLAWLNTSPLTGEKIYEELVKYDVHILPGRKFYWNNPEKGANYVRIALARTTEDFTEAVKIIKKVVTNLGKFI